MPSRGPPPSGIWVWRQIDPEPVESRNVVWASGTRRRNTHTREIGILDGAVTDAKYCGVTNRWLRSYMIWVFMALVLQGLLMPLTFVCSTNVVLENRINNRVCNFWSTSTPRTGSLCLCQPLLCRPLLCRPLLCPVSPRQLEYLHTAGESTTDARCGE